MQTEDSLASPDGDPSRESGTKDTLRRERTIAVYFTHRKILRYIEDIEEVISTQEKRTTAIAQMVRTVPLYRVDRIRFDYTPSDVSKVVTALARWHGIDSNTKAKDIWERGYQAIAPQYLQLICFNHTDEEVCRSSEVTLPPTHTDVAPRRR